MLGPLLALGASLFGGTADFVGGTTSRRIGTIQFMFWTQSLGLLLAGGWVAVGGERVPDLATFATASLAGVSLAVGLAAFFQAMAVGTISIVAPISALGVVVPIAAGIARGERLNLAQGLGILAAATGMTLAARRPPRHARVSARSRAVSRSGVGLALFSALSGGVCLWLIAPASRGGVAWTLLVVRAVTVAMLVVVLSVRHRSPRAAFEPRIACTVLASVALGFIGFTLYAFATLHGQLAIVSVLASLYPAVTVLLAHRLLGERLHHAQRFGVAAVLLGVALLSS